MSIQVVFENGAKGMVSAEMLDYLLENGGIISFKRYEGWVRPDSDRIRARDLMVFSIPERRSVMNSLLSSTPEIPVNRLS